MKPFDSVKKKQTNKIKRKKKIIIIHYLIHFTLIHCVWEGEVDDSHLLSSSIRRLANSVTKVIKSACFLDGIRDAKQCVGIIDVQRHVPQAGPFWSHRSRP